MSKLSELVRVLQPFTIIHRPKPYIASEVLEAQLSKVYVLPDGVYASNNAVAVFADCCTGEMQSHDANGVVTELSTAPAFGAVFARWTQGVNYRVDVRALLSWLRALAEQIDEHHDYVRDPGLGHVEVGLMVGGRVVMYNLDQLTGLIAFVVERQGVAVLQFPERPAVQPVRVEVGGFAAVLMPCDGAGRGFGPYPYVCPVTGQGVGTFYEVG